MAVDQDKIDAGIESVIDNGQSFMIDGVQYTAASLTAMIRAKNMQNENGGRVTGTRPLMRRFNLGGLDSNGTA